MHDGNAFGFEQLGDEILVRLDDLARRRGLADQAGAGRVDVEGAFRRRARNALGLVQHRDDQIAAAFEDLLVLGDEVLRAVQRLDGRPLRDRGGARGLLTLDHVHGLDELKRTGSVADAPAGHGIGLGDAVHRQRAVIKAGLDFDRGRELEVAIGQVLVHVVGQHPDMRMLHQHVRQRLQFGMAVGSARRVGRRVEDEPLGLRRNRLVQVLRREFEVVFLGGRDEHRRAAAQRHHFRIGDPVGRRDDDFIARVQGRHERVEKNLLSAGADNRLGGGVIKVVLALELLGDRFAQFRNAGDRRVLRLAAVDGVDRRLLDIVGRIEVRLPGAEADHITTFRFQLTGFLRNGDSGGRLYTGEGIGKEGHG
ncbi:hypothetical protein D9M70_458930 [compost metagenome]